jgi:hypothetical protein
VIEFALVTLSAAVVGWSLLVGKLRSAFTSGFLIAASSLFFTASIPFGVHPRFPGGGLWGASGIIGACGALLVLGSGLLLHRSLKSIDSPREIGAADPETL